MRKYFLGLAFIITLGLGANQINAETPAQPEVKSGIVAEKQKKYAAKQAEWDALSKEQKLKTLNDRQAKKVKSMQDRWAKMTPEQKIARYEGGMKRGQAMSLKSAEYREKCDQLLGKGK